MPFAPHVRPVVAPGPDCKIQVMIVPITAVSPETMFKIIQPLEMELWNPMEVPVGSTPNARRIQYTPYLAEFKTEEDVVEYMKTTTEELMKAFRESKR